MEDGKSRSSHDHFRYATQSVTGKMHLSADRPGSPESTQNPCYLGNAGKVAVSNTAGPLNKTKEEDEGGGQNLLSGKLNSSRSGTCGNHY